jgi:Na+-driven multidrug efflux pump|tara:strand:- start:557 stop:844 length:288 start_codon:yes stop_codon:yes gene_type:complete
LGTIKKDILIGILISLFATAAGIFLYIEYFSKYNFKETFTMIQEAGLYGKILALAAIPNLFVFFIFIRKKQDNRAKGVLFTTILIALTTLILKFF